MYQKEQESPRYRVVLVACGFFLTDRKFQEKIAPKYYLPSQEMCKS